MKHIKTHERIPPLDFKDDRLWVMEPQGQKKRRKRHVPWGVIVPTIFFGGFLISLVGLTTAMVYDKISSENKLKQTWDSAGISKEHIYYLPEYNMPSKTKIIAEMAEYVVAGKVFIGVGNEVFIRGDGLVLKMGQQKYEVLP